MKKRILIAVILTFFVTGVSLAQMDKGMTSEQGTGMMDDSMMKGIKMDGKMMGMCPMMQSMMQRSVVASGDGGIIIVTGNKITKYDKDLNVIKEVELKMDMEGMQKMMGSMKGMCPMCSMMKDKRGTENNIPAKVSAEKKPQQSEHESHH